MAESQSSFVAGELRFTSGANSDDLHSAHSQMRQSRAKKRHRVEKARFWMHQPRWRRGGVVNAHSTEGLRWVEVHFLSTVGCATVVQDFDTSIGRIFEGWSGFQKTIVAVNGSGCTDGEEGVSVVVGHLESLGGKV